jgi:hypothetical protein
MGQGHQGGRHQAGVRRIIGFRNPARLMSARGLGCVKTHTEKRCRKYNSPGPPSTCIARFDSHVFQSSRNILHARCPLEFSHGQGHQQKHSAEQFSSAFSSGNGPTRLDSQAARNAAFASLRLSDTPPLGPCDGARLFIPRSPRPRAAESPQQAPRHVGPCNIRNHRTGRRGLFGRARCGLARSRAQRTHFGYRCRW